MENSGDSVIKGAPITGDGMGEKERERARERERERRVYWQLHELDYKHTRCEIQNTC